MSEVLLEVKNLKKYFDTPNGVLHAVDDVSFRLEKGKTLGVVGESGCGKSTTGRAILRLHEPTSGEVIFEGRDITKLSSQEMRGLRSDMQIIFQDPFASLNPRKTVSEIIAEPLRLHKVYKNKQDQEKRVLELMELVGLSERLTNTYPHELDGGRRQRIGIARALAMNPKFIVCDEPVSALDVSIQAQILNLLMDLKDEFHFSYLFIAHNLSVVKHISNQVAVMYLGSIVEKGSKGQIFASPQHPYTKALFSSIPTLTGHNMRNAEGLEGEIPSAVNLPSGCCFHTRCRCAMPVCSQRVPEEREIAPGHWVQCHLFDR